MLGLLTIGRLLFKATPMGAAYSAFRNALYVTDLLFDLALANEVQEQAKKGVNREEEKFHHEMYGGTEPFFPFFVNRDDFPEPLAVRIGEGNFIWKTSEWVEFLQWVGAVLADRDMGRDGQWLMKVGRERWEDLKWRSEAFKNVEMNPDLVSKYKSMQKSPR